VLGFCDGIFDKRGLCGFSLSEESKQTKQTFFFLVMKVKLFSFCVTEKAMSHLTSETFLLGLKSDELVRGVILSGSLYDLFRKRCDL